MYVYVCTYAGTGTGFAKQPDSQGSVRVCLVTTSIVAQSPSGETKLAANQACFTLFFTVNAKSGVILFLVRVFVWLSSSRRLACFLGTSTRFTIDFHFNYVHKQEQHNCN